MTFPALLGAGGLALGGMGTAAPGPADEEVPSPSPETLRPITYFNDKCANCHGNYGSFWGEGFAAELSDAELHEIVEEMAAGPAQAPLDEAALAVQTAYHRSLVDGRPFIVAWREGETWRGEVTPKAKVRAGSAEADVKGHAWTFDGDVDELTVLLGDATTTLSLDEKQRHGVWYSHRKEAATRPVTTQDAQE